MDELVKGKSKWDEDCSSSFTTCEVPELPMRGYLPYSDFKKREFVLDPPTQSFSVAMKSAEHEQPATFSDHGENSTANQLTWQDKMETSDYMTLVRRPEDTETSDYMTLIRRPEYSETSDYMTLVRRPKDSDSVYQSLTYNKEMSSPSASGKLDEGFQSTENVYQPLDLSRMKKLHDSSTYQTLSQFYND